MSDFRISQRWRRFDTYFMGVEPRMDGPEKNVALKQSPVWIDLLSIGTVVEEPLEGFCCVGTPGGCFTIKANSLELLELISEIGTRIRSDPDKWVDPDHLDRTEKDDGEEEA